jgi:flagellar basal body rod protein FlgG
MNIGLYQSAASLTALEHWQDAVSQNITSSQVSGYRKRTVEFSSQDGGQWNLDPNSSTTGDTSQTAQFPKISNGINYLPGDTQPSGRDLDVAIQGPGFFEVQSPDGSHAFTRDGEFSVRSDRTLVNGSGAEVLSDSGSPIVLAANGDKVPINKDGTIIQGTATVGRLGVEDFPDTTQLQPLAGGLFAAADGATPTPVEQPDLLQGYTEASNVTPMREMVDMVLISRCYDANQKIIKSADEEMQKTLDALG